MKWREFKRKWTRAFLTAGCVTALLLLYGCTAPKEEKVRDMEFAVAAAHEIPQDLAQIIAEKQQSPFKLTYSDNDNLYIVVGYGEQAGGSYSIQVHELYLTENSIVIDTELLGPETGEAAGEEKSYPFIVVKTEYSDLSVIFQ